MSNFEKLHLCDAKIDQNTNFDKLLSDFFVNLIIQELKFFKRAQLFVTSVSLARGFSEGIRENIFHIFRTLLSPTLFGATNAFFFCPMIHTGVKYVFLHVIHHFFVHRVKDMVSYTQEYVKFIDEYLE